MGGCKLFDYPFFSWIKRFTGYYDVVALVMLSTFIVTQCFLLYTLQNPLTRNSMSFVVFMAGAFIIFALCLFGELITIEVSVGQGGYNKNVLICPLIPSG